MHEEVSSGRTFTAWALLDSASETSIVELSWVHKLGLPLWDVNTAIIGVGGRQAGVATKRISFSLKTTRLTSKVSALVLRNINLVLPSVNLRREKWTHLDQLTLADPEFYRARRVDMILGADIYGDLILEGVHRGLPNEPVAQKTSVGWMLTGSTRSCLKEMPNLASKVLNYSVVDEAVSISHELQRFWELEETSVTPTPSPEDVLCENLFVSEHRRLLDGRYCVPLPRRATLTSDRLGDTLSLARQSLNAVRKKMSRDDAFREQYEAFMEQYEGHGHMEHLKEQGSCRQSHGRSQIMERSCELCLMPLEGPLMESPLTSSGFQAHHYTIIYCLSFSGGGGIRWYFVLTSR